MDNINMSEKLNMLDKIYSFRELDFEEESSKDRKEIAKKLNDATLEEMEKAIKENIKEQSQREQVLQILEKLIENYEIQTAYYMEKRYKQGFKDAMNLLSNR